MISNPPVPFDLAGKRIFVAGHSGMAGSAIVRRLRQEPCEVLLASHRELDLTHQEPTENYFSSTRPDVVVMAAGRVGGILANDRYPVEFLADNLAMELNCIRASHIAGVQRLLFLGSSCIYPKFAKQPMSEDQLLTGELEPTNQWYAVAKIAGVKLCEAYRRQYGCDFISVTPTNLYGPGDNYHPEHVDSMKRKLPKRRPSLYGALARPAVSFYTSTILQMLACSSLKIIPVRNSSTLVLAQI